VSIWIPNMHVCILVLSAHLVVYMRCDCTCVHLRVRVSVWHTSTILMVVHMMFPFPVHVRSFPLFPPTSASRHVLRAFALSLSLPIFLACSRSRSHTHTHTHTHSLSHTNAPTFSYTLIHAHTRTHTHTSYTRHIPAWSHTERDKTPGIYDLKLVCWGVFACKEMRIHTNKQMPYTHWNLSVGECLHAKKCAYTRTNRCHTHIETCLLGSVCIQRNAHTHEQTYMSYTHTNICHMTINAHLYLKISNWKPKRYYYWGKLHHWESARHSSHMVRARRAPDSLGLKNFNSKQRICHSIRTTAV